MQVYLVKRWSNFTNYLHNSFHSKIIMILVWEQLNLYLSWQEA